MSDFGEGAWRKARKEHRCEYCSGPIPAGETYFRFVGMFDDEFQNWAMHEECHAAYNDSGEYEFMPGDGEMPERVKALIQERRGA